MGLHAKGKRTATVTVMVTISCVFSLLVAMMTTVTIAKPGHFVSIPVAAVFVLTHTAVHPVLPPIFAASKGVTSIVVEEVVRG